MESGGSECHDDARRSAARPLIMAATSDDHPDLRGCGESSTDSIGRSGLPFGATQRTGAAMITRSRLNPASTCEGRFRWNQKHEDSTACPAKTEIAANARSLCLTQTPAKSLGVFAGVALDVRSLKSLRGTLREARPRRRRLISTSSAICASLAWCQTLPQKQPAAKADRNVRAGFQRPPEGCLLSPWRPWDLSRRYLFWS